MFEHNHSVRALLPNTIQLHGNFFFSHGQSPKKEKGSQLSPNNKMSSTFQTWKDKVYMSSSRPHVSFWLHVHVSEMTANPAWKRALLMLTSEVKVFSSLSQNSLPHRSCCSKSFQTVSTSPEKPKRHESQYELLRKHVSMKPKCHNWHAWVQLDRSITCHCNFLETNITFTVNSRLVLRH